MLGHYTTGPFNAGESENNAVREQWESEDNVVGGQASGQHSSGANAVGVALGYQDSNLD